MNMLDMVIKRVCPACKFEEAITQYHVPPSMSHLVPNYAGVPMHAGSHMELRVDLRFICCEHCGNPVMYLHIDAKNIEPPQTDRRD